MTFVRAAGTCGTGWFKCHNDRCIPAAWICDGQNGCGDMSDEWHCDGQVLTGIDTNVSLLNVT